MSMSPRPFVGKVSRCKPLTALAVAAAGALAVGASVQAESSSIESGLPAAKMDCKQVTHNGEDYWECFVSSSGVVNVADLPGGVSTKPVIITAAGAPGYGVSGTEGHGGRGGAARTVVEGDDLNDAFYVYTRGPKGSNLSGRGGSATVVSEMPIEHVEHQGDVFVVAGGGGAQGNRGGSFDIRALRTECGFGSGGAGGVADAALAADFDQPSTDPVPAYAAGKEGRGGEGESACGFSWGHAPSGGGKDDMTNSGSAGKQPGDSRSDGHSGIGGVGGYDDDWWRDADDNKVAAGHSAGAGGHSTVHANGGGGYGGGAAGERNYGGAGGGSYARAATASPADFSLITNELDVNSKAGDVGVKLLYRA